MQVFRDREACAGVPAGAVQHEDDLLGRTGAGLACEGGQLRLEEREAHGGGEVEERPSRTGMDKADEVAPGVAVLDRRDGPLPVEAPDFVQDGFQPDTVLVRRPELDLGVREGGGDRLDERPEVFLKVSC